MTNKGNDSTELTGWRLWMDIFFHLNHHYRIYSTVFQTKNSFKTLHFVLHESSVVLRCGRGVLPNSERNFGRDGLQIERLIQGLMHKVDWLVFPASSLPPLPKVWVMFAFFQSLGLIIMIFQKMIMSNHHMVSTSSLFHLNPLAKSSGGGKNPNLVLYLIWLI